MTLLFANKFSKLQIGDKGHIYKGIYMTPLPQMTSRKGTKTFPFDVNKKRSVLNRAWGRDRGGFHYGAKKRVPVAFKVVVAGYLLYGWERGGKNRDGSLMEFRKMGSACVRGDIYLIINQARGLLLGGVGGQPEKGVS